MAISNLNNTHLTASETNDAKDDMTNLENKLVVVLTINLTAEDRQRYGSINEQNKLVVNKVKDYHVNQPELQSPQVDWNEFDNDFVSRATMENLIGRLESMTTRLKNAKILYDYDNYQAALTDYAFTSFMAGTATPGYEDKMNDIKQFFGRNTPKTTGSTDAPTS